MEMCPPRGSVSLRARLFASLPDRPMPIGWVDRQSLYGGTTPVHLTRGNWNLFCQLAFLAPIGIRNKIDIRMTSLNSERFNYSTFQLFNAFSSQLLNIR